MFFVDRDSNSVFGMFALQILGILDQKLLKLVLVVEVQGLTVLKMLALLPSLTVPGHDSVKEPRGYDWHQRGYDTQMSTHLGTVRTPLGADKRHKNVESREGKTALGHYIDATSSCCLL